MRRMRICSFGPSNNKLIWGIFYIVDIQRSVPCQAAKHTHCASHISNFFLPVISMCCRRLDICVICLGLWKVLICTPFIVTHSPHALALFQPWSWLFLLCVCGTRITLFSLIKVDYCVSIPHPRAYVQTIECNVEIVDAMIWIFGDNLHYIGWMSPATGATLTNNYMASRFANIRSCNELQVLMMWLAQIFVTISIFVFHTFGISISAQCFVRNFE